MLKKIMLLTLVSAFVFFGNIEAKEFKSVKIGDAEVIALLDLPIEMESSLIKNGNPDEIKKYMPDGKFGASINAYIVKTGTQTVLVDAGMGKNLVSVMKAAGTEPEQIDLVLITHGHFDHVGGMVKNGKAVFTKAKVLIADKEKPLYEDAGIEKIPAEYKKYFIPANEMLKVYGSRIETFTPGKKVAEGIVSVDLSGHTAGHAGIHFMHIMHSVDLTLSPFLTYLEIKIAEGQAFVHAPQSVHLSLFPFIFKIEILEKFFKNIEAGQRYLQKALLSFIFTARIMPVK